MRNVVIVSLLVSTGVAGIASAQITPIVSVSHQTSPNGTYAAAYGPTLAQSHALEVFTTSMGSRGSGAIWDFDHVSDGTGWGGRNFMRYSRWAGVDGNPQAGFYWALNATPPSGGWSAMRTSPIYFRWRMRVVAPMGESTGHGAMKWLIFGGPGLSDGNARFIVFLYSGSYVGAQFLGRTVADSEYTGICLNAGVSGSRACGLVRNGEWVNVQAAVRWGPTGTAYQRLYVDNNDVNAPSHENTVFADLSGATWAFPDLGGGNPGMAQWGNIVTTNSASSTNFVVDWMDFLIDDVFDPGWSTAPNAPGDLRAQ